MNCWNTMSWLESLLAFIFFEGNLRLLIFRKTNSQAAKKKKKFIPEWPVNSFFNILKFHHEKDFSNLIIFYGGWGGAGCKFLLLFFLFSKIFLYLFCVVFIGMKGWIIKFNNIRVFSFGFEVRFTCATFWTLWRTHLK